MVQKINELYSELWRYVMPQDAYKGMMILCFLKKLGIENKERNINKTIKLITDIDLRMFVEEFFDKYNNLKCLYEKFDINLENEDVNKDLFDEDHINIFDSEYSTPKCFIKLCSRLLDIQKDDEVLDLCSGYGNFLHYISDAYQCSALSGIELDTNAVSIAKIKAYLTYSKYTITQSDVFVYESQQFSKIFSNYPLGMQVRYLPTSKKVVERLKEKSYGNLTSADWAFNYKICDLLKDDGKAVVITTNGTLINNSERQVREFFLKSGLIEAVISMPAKLFKNTSIPVNIIVLSKKWKDGIRFIDAKDIYVKGRRNNDLSDENIEEILSLYNSDSKNSRNVPLAEIFKESSVLNPARYLEENIKNVENGIEFGKVIKSITRGAPLSGIDLDNIMSTEPTDTQYLMLSNIKDGLIEESLPYLKELDKKFEKYYIKDRNIVMSKNGYPFKVAVFENHKNKNVLANGNMFVIEVDEAKMNPYYIKVFLDSEAGIAALKSITVGSTIPNIGQEALKKILLPNVPLEEQQGVVNKYLAKKDEIEYLKKQLSKAIDSLNHLMD